jgi:hypothetical protein
MSWTAFAIGSIVAISAYVLGHYSGENRGRALGWLERNQEELDRERKRRAPNGRFRSARGGVR